MNADWTNAGKPRPVDGVMLETSPIGGPVLRLAANGATAEIALQGAQVLSWQPRGHAPAIWLSPMERLRNPPAAPKPVRGGTPVCWPWFANHPSDPAKPPHGFVRTREWACDAVETSDTGVRVRLHDETTTADRALWPHTARVCVTVTLGQTLAIELETHNTGSEAFMLSQALHTYFAVGDIEDISVEGFDGLTYQDKLDGGARKRQDGAIRFAGEVDRIYDTHEGRAMIVDPGLRRRIVIEKSGSRSSVVWNPWSAKAARMGDMGPMGWRRMVCVETSNSGDDVAAVAAGARHLLAARYQVAPL